MPRISHIWHMRDEKRSALLEWLENEPNVPPAAEIADDGRFSVHNGRISGNRFVLTGDGNKIAANRNSLLKSHFNVKQVNPLPDIVLED